MENSTITSQETSLGSSKDLFRHPLLITTRRKTTTWTWTFYTETSPVTNSFIFHWNVLSVLYHLTSLPSLSSCCCRLPLMKISWCWTCIQYQELRILNVNFVPEIESKLEQVLRTGGEVRWAPAWPLTGPPLSHQLSAGQLFSIQETRRSNVINNTLNINIYIEINFNKLYKITINHHSHHHNAVLTYWLLVKRWWHCVCQWEAFHVEWQRAKSRTSPASKDTITTICHYQYHMWYNTLSQSIIRYKKNHKDLKWSIWMIFQWFSC